MKKLLLLLLTLLLLPMAVSAEDVEIDGIYYRLNSDVKYANVISHPNKYSGDIVIPSTVYYDGINYTVKGIDNEAFIDCSGLTSIFIPSSVVPFGGNPFQGCSNLASIVVEGGNSYYDSRDNCNAMISISNVHESIWVPNVLIVGCKNTVIPSSVTSISDDAFIGSGLESITIPSSVTDIGGGAFDGCSSLASIVVEEGNPQYDSRDNCNAIIDKTYDKLIAGCKNTVIPSSVTIIGERAFKGLALTSIVIPSSVTAIYDMAFARCSALTDVYCFAENVPTTSSRAFLGSSYQTATLHVAPASIEKYKNAAPWKDFRKIVSYYMCATPTIASANGKLTFSCKTEGVEFVASVSPSGKTTYKGSSLLLADLTTTYRVSVYARKEGYEDSEAATIDIDYLPDLDDVNGDGQISISDVVGIVDIILKGN